MEMIFVDLASMVEIPPSLESFVRRKSFEATPEGPFIALLLRPDQAPPEGMPWHILSRAQNGRLQNVHHDPEVDDGFIAKEFEIGDNPPVVGLMYVMGLAPEDVSYVYDDDEEGDSRFRDYALQLLSDCVKVAEIEERWPSRLV